LDEHYESYLISVQEALTSGESKHLVYRIEILLPNLVKNLEPPTNVDGHGTRRKFEKIVRVLDVLAGKELFTSYFYHCHFPYENIY
jgi:hypothetical protein